MRKRIKKLNHFFLGTIGKEQADVADQIGRYFVDTFQVFALGIAAQCKWNKLVFAEEEFTIGAEVSTQVFEKYVTLIEHGYDEHVLVCVQGFADFCDKILFEFETFLLGHRQRNLNTHT